MSVGDRLFPIVLLNLYFQFLEYSSFVFFVCLFVLSSLARGNHQLPVLDAPEHSGRPLLQRPHAVSRLPLGAGRLRVRGDVMNDVIIRDSRRREKKDSGCMQSTLIIIIIIIIIMIVIIVIVTVLRTHFASLNAFAGSRRAPM